MAGATAGKIAGVTTTHIRTYHPRGGRMSGRHLDALDRLWPRYGVAVDGAPLDPAGLFGRRAPLVLEIGSGMGDATAAMAAADPGRDYLGVDVHTPGIANLLALVEARGLTNVRVAQGDALELIRHMLPPAGLAAVHVFFPDPWPKLKHHKRRLIQPAHLPTLRAALEPGGVLHCATDWAPYAEAMLAALSADPELVNAHDGFAPRPAYRPLTRFERRGVRAGRRIFDLVFRRVTP
jgi:tRNA (guanine-N7-)-methyltransferase